MRVESSHLTEREGVQEVGVLIGKELGWLYREQPVSDFGIDAHVELVVDGEANGNLIALQVKSGPSFFSRPGGDGWAFTFDDEHYQYWVHHDLPVVVVLYDPKTGLAYWQAITHETAVSTGSQWKVVVPRAQRLDGRSAPALRDLAVEPRPRGDAPAQRFQAAIYHLPADVASRLERAHQAAGAGAPGNPRRGVERLAAHLADGRLDPAEACRLLLDRPPGWLPTACRELWLVVAAYANEHGLPAQTAQAFLRAVEDNPDVEGRLRALAGLAQMQVDRVGSRAALEAARALPGGQLLADIGLAQLDHDGGTGPVPLPVSVLAAASGSAGEDATIQRFLGDRALAAQDIDAAVGHYEQALAVAATSTSMQITLAHALLRRANVGHPPLGGQDTLQALRLAETARADRRRWNGPSEEAAEVLQSARALRLDLPGAIAVARRPPAGEATEREARSSPLAVRAAAVALRGQQTDAAEELEREVSDPGDRAYLEAVRADVEGLEPSERERRWRVAIASTEDDDRRMQVAHHLAELGQWPIPELDRTRNEGVLREDVYEVLHARAEAAGGATGSAVARLRRVAPHSAMAVQELALVLEAAGRTGEAVAACNDGARRFGDPGLRLLALDLLRRSDRPDEARDRTVQMLARRDLPPDLRLRLRESLVRDGSLRRDWPFVEDQAADALSEIIDETAEAVPADLRHFQWALIGARFNQRRRQEAWAAIEQLDPPIRNEQDARIWLSLAATRVWTAERVRRALALVEQFEDDALLGAAVLEALLVALRREDQETPDDEPAGPIPAEPPEQGATADLTADETAELGASLQQAVQRYTARHPEGPFRAIPADAGDILDLVRAQLAPGAQQTRQVARSIWQSAAPVGLAATVTRRPYMQALLQRVGGMIPAATADPAAYDAELAAAKAALGGGVALEPSALAVSTLLGDRWDRLRAEFSAVSLPHSCLDDIHHTEQALRTLQASTLTVHIDPDTGQLVRSSLTPDEKALLRDRLAAVASAARTATPAEVTSLDHATEQMGQGVDAKLASSTQFTLDADGAWLAPVELALTRGLPLWSDDVVLRLLAREMGIPTFGTLALTHVLIAQGSLPDTTREDLATLLADYVVDLPLNLDLLLAGAEADEWQSATVATAIGRPAAWIHNDVDATELWLALGRAVVEHRPDALPRWFHAAATGCAAARPTDPTAFVARLLAITLARVTGLQRSGVRALLPAAQAAAQAAGGGDVLHSLSQGLIAYLQSPTGGRHGDLEAQRIVQDLLEG